jgi:exodeoxyribonuclease VII small subunit
MEEILTYELAYKELEEITKAIESESVSVDVLAKKVKRASDLITFCQKMLRSTETEVNTIIKEIENPDTFINQ